MSRGPALLFGCFLFAFAPACSDEAGPAPAADGGAAAARLEGGAAVGVANVTVDYAGNGTVVNVAALPRSDYRGSSVVSLATAACGLVTWK
jgi:hypothetical protein